MKNLFKKIVSIGLAATMALSMAVTSFAADEVEPEVATPTFSSDAKGETGIETIEDGLWLAGSKKAVLDAESEETTDLSQMVIYTNAEAPEGGKVLVGVTAEDGTVPYDEEDGKIIKDAEADAIVKASYKAKDSSIVIKPSKAAGTAKVWVVVLNEEKEIAASASIPVTVKSAASKIGFYETVTETNEDDEEVQVEKTLKSVVIPVEEDAEVAFKGIGKDKAVTTDSSYTCEVDEKYSDNIEAEITEDGKLKVTAKALDTDEDGVTIAKVVKAKVTVVCKESGKKASLTVSVTNPVDSIAPEIVANAEGEEAVDQLLYAKDVSTISIAVTTAAGEGVATTDKIKVYVAAPEAEEVTDDEGNVIEEAITTCAVSEDGKKVVYTKSNAVTAKLSKDGSTLVITRKEVFEAAEIYLAYTDASDKSIELIKVCDVKAMVPTAGNIVIAGAASESENA